jgi:predicted small metal-binding protein
VVGEAMLWQVTCQCGWRTHGTKVDVVAAVQRHGREAHNQNLSEEDVMGIAVQLGDQQDAGA